MDTPSYYIRGLRSRIGRLRGRVSRLQRRLRGLRRIMPARDILKLDFHERREGIAAIYLKPLNRSVSIRRGTTDLECLIKVFLYEEYLSPFEMSPRVIIDAGANIGMATLFFAHRYPD